MCSGSQIVTLPENVFVEEKKKLKGVFARALPRDPHPMPSRQPAFSAAESPSYSSRRYRTDAFRYHARTRSPDARVDRADLGRPVKNCPLRLRPLPSSPSPFPFSRLDAFTVAVVRLSRSPTPCLISARRSPPT